MSAKTVRVGSSRIELNLTPLEKLKADIGNNARARVHVGILRDKNSARLDGETNASIGLKHEFGDPMASCASKQQQRARGRGPICWTGVPERSFIRMPLITKLPEEMKNEPFGGWVHIAVNHGILFALETLGFMGESVIQDAFATHGFGTWLPNSLKTIRWKKSASPLIDSAEMRQSITSKVVR